jgi:hypothetical protein
MEGLYDDAPIGAPLLNIPANTTIIGVMGNRGPENTVPWHRLWQFWWLALLAANIPITWDMLGVTEINGSICDGYILIPMRHSGWWATNDQGQYERQGPGIDPFDPIRANIITMFKAVVCPGCGRQGCTIPKFIDLSIHFSDSTGKYWLPEMWMKLIAFISAKHGNPWVADYYDDRDRRLVGIFPPSMCSWVSDPDYWSLLFAFAGVYGMLMLSLRADGAGMIQWRVCLPNAYPTLEEYYMPEWLYDTVEYILFAYTRHRRRNYIIQNRLDPTLVVDRIAPVVWNDDEYDGLCMLLFAGFFDCPAVPYLLMSGVYRWDYDFMRLFFVKKSGVSPDYPECFDGVHIQSFYNGLFANLLSDFFANLIDYNRFFRRIQTIDRTALARNARAHPLYNPIALAHNAQFLSVPMLMRMIRNDRTRDGETNPFRWYRIARHLQEIGGELFNIPMSPESPSQSDNDALDDDDPDVVRNTPEPFVAESPPQPDSDANDDSLEVIPNTQEFVPQPHRRPLLHPSPARPDDVDPYDQPSGYDDDDFWGSDHDAFDER